MFQKTFKDGFSAHTGAYKRTSTTPAWLLFLLVRVHCMSMGLLRAGCVALLLPRPVLVLLIWLPAKVNTEY